MNHHLQFQSQMLNCFLLSLLAMLMMLMMIKQMENLHQCEDLLVRGLVLCEVIDLRVANLCLLALSKQAMVLFHFLLVMILV